MNNSADTVFNTIKDKKILFHSGISDNNADIEKYGITPQKGDWLRQMIATSIDDEDFANEILENTPDISFYSEKPCWVSMKVALKLDKSVGEVTWDEVKEHGQLSIVLIDEYAEDTFKHAKTLDNSDCVEKSYYLGTSEVADYELPFGVERNDIYTEEDIVPDYTLTGNDLVSFLKSNYPKSNIIKENKLKRKIRNI